MLVSRLVLNLKWAAHREKAQSAKSIDFSIRFGLSQASQPSRVDSIIGEIGAPLASPSGEEEAPGLGEEGDEGRPVCLCDEEALVINMRSSSQESQV